MVRLTRPIARVIELMFEHIEYAHPQVYDSLCKFDPQGFLEKKSRRAKLANNDLKDLDDGCPYPVTDVTGIKRALNGGGGEEVLDTIMKLVQMSRAGNLFHGSLVDQIRKAIFGDSEVATLQEQIKQAKMHCAYCKREMKAGQLASLMMVHDDTLDLVCEQCQPPASVICSCGENRPFHDVYKWQDPPPCTHSKKKAEKLADLSIKDIINADAGLGALRAHLRGARVQAANVRAGNPAMRVPPPPPRQWVPVRDDPQFLGAGGFALPIDEEVF